MDVPKPRKHKLLSAEDLPSKIKKLNEPHEIFVNEHLIPVKDGDFGGQFFFFSPQPIQGDSRVLAPDFKLHIHWAREQILIIEPDYLLEVTFEHEAFNDRHFMVLKRFSMTFPQPTRVPEALEPLVNMLPQKFRAPGQPPSFRNICYWSSMNKADLACIFEFFWDYFELTESLYDGNKVPWLRLQEVNCVLNTLLIQLKFAMGVKLAPKVRKESGVAYDLRGKRKEIK